MSPLRCAAAWREKRSGPGAPRRSMYSGGTATRIYCSGATMRVLLKRQQTLCLARNIAHLRQYLIFELRVVGDPRIKGGNAADGRIEIRKQLVGGTRGDLRAIAPGERVFMRD